MQSLSLGRERENKARGRGWGKAAHTVDIPRLSCERQAKPNRGKGRPPCFFGESSAGLPTKLGRAKGSPSSESAVHIRVEQG